MNITAKAYTAITLQSLITGFSFLALKIALRSADTMDLLAHRFTLAALSVLIFTLFRRGSLTIHLRDFLRILPYGIISHHLFSLPDSGHDADFLFGGRDYLRCRPYFHTDHRGASSKGKDTENTGGLYAAVYRRRHLHPSDERISALRVQLYRFWADHRLRRLPGAV